MVENPQVALWNAEPARAWVEHVDEFDSTLRPFGEAVLERLGLRPGERVVDIGCGVGGTTMAIASIVAPAIAVGVDVSEPMLDAARARAATTAVANVEFRRFDVQDDSFHTESFDVAFSRFGVMFFTEPERAFANIRRALAEQGRLGFVCFQGPFDNPLILAPVMAAAAHVELLSPPGPTDPSPFSLADPDRIQSLLDGAGFVDVVVEQGPSSADLGAADDIEMVARRALEQNPGIAPGFAKAPPDARAAAVTAAAEALLPHVVGGRVIMGAATWVVTARVGLAA